MDNQQVKPKPWVKLHMMPQTEVGHTMPPYIIGILQGESPTHYTLTNVLDGMDENGEMVERKYPDVFSKTYVWRCEIIGDKLPNNVIDDEMY
jgi:hypothetical protein